MLVYDIEGDGFVEDVTKIHCICIWDTEADTKLWYVSPGKLVIKKIPGWKYGGTVERGIRLLKWTGDIKVAHYQLSYDLQVIKKLHDVDMLKDHLLDTGIVSRLVFPENMGTSIEWWAKELALPQSKVQNDDWSELSQNMLERCCSDVEINKAVILLLIWI